MWAAESCDGSSRQCLPPSFQMSVFALWKSQFVPSDIYEDDVWGKKSKSHMERSIFKNSATTSNTWRFFGGVCLKWLKWSEGLQPRCWSLRHQGFQWRFLFPSRCPLTRRLGGISLGRGEERGVFIDNLSSLLPLWILPPHWVPPGEKPSSCLSSLSSLQWTNGDAGSWKMEEKVQGYFSTLVQRMNW